MNEAPSIAILSPLLLLAAAGCAGGSSGAMSVPTTADIPPADGCDAQRGCPCADGPTELGEPRDGRRRFQIGLGGAPGTRVAARIEGVGSVVRSDDDPGERCFRVDLVPGSVYSVSLLAVSTERNVPLSSQWQIMELATAVLFPSDPNDPASPPPERRPAVYSTFQTGCGTRSGPCRLLGARAWLSELDQTRGEHDACGSTRIRAIRASGMELPNDGRLSDVEISFQMEVRDQPPQHPPETRACIVPR